MSKHERGTKRIWLWVVGLMMTGILTAVIVVVTLNLAEIQDYFAGLGYEPTAEMARIRDELGLTERAQRIFRAAWPELDERGDFNRNCRSGEETDIAILGCYTGGRIYVYNIVTEELAGVREVAVAHELLHAVWERMSEGEREALAGELAEVLAKETALESELLTYDEDKREEELYARVGTEVRELPEALARHYAGVFGEQGKVVTYYERYIAVFREIEERLKEIGVQLEVSKAALDEAVANYERRQEQWSADVTSFNACAATEGCFRSNTEFTNQRAGLTRVQSELIEMYNAIDTMVQEYNALVDEYNSNVIHGQMLNDTVNSLSVPDEIGE